MTNEQYQVHWFTGETVPTITAEHVSDQNDSDDEDEANEGDVFVESDSNSDYESDRLLMTFRYITI